MNDPYDHGLHRLVLATALILALIILYYGSRRGYLRFRPRPARSPAAGAQTPAPEEPPEPRWEQDIPGVSPTQDLPLSAPALPAEAPAGLRR